MLLPGVSDTSEATHRIVDEEVRRIVDEAEHDSVLLLGRERHRLDALASALLERETLDQAEAYEIAGVDAPRAALDEAATVAPPAAT
jgi:cell division protease FtsH